MNRVYLSAIALTCSSAIAQPIIRHIGATDPETESFQRVGQGTQTFGPEKDDQGESTWWMASTNFMRYQTGDLSPSIKDDALAFGWKMTGRFRVPIAPDDRGLVTLNLENLGGLRFDINIGLNDDGDTFVRLNENIVGGPIGIGPTVVLEGSGDGYHTIELIFDPASQTADLFIDKVEMLSDYPGHANFVRSLGFYMGVYQDYIGNYAFAQFELLAARRI